MEAELGIVVAPALAGKDRHDRPAVARDAGRLVIVAAVGVCAGRRGRGRAVEAHEFQAELEAANEVLDHPALALAPLEGLQVAVGANGDGEVVLGLVVAVHARREGVLEGAAAVGHDPEGGAGRLAALLDASRGEGRVELVGAAEQDDVGPAHGPARDPNEEEGLVLYLAEV